MPFYYTDHAVLTESSVISDIFYSNLDRLLVVKLNSGSLAGYAEVSPEVAKVFMNQEAQGGSAGRYWNTLIKPYFSGFDTSWINDEFKAHEDDKDEDTALIAQAPVADEDPEDNFLLSFPKLVDLMNSLNFDTPIEDVTKITELSVNQGDLAEFTVFFTYADLAGNENSDALTVFAVDNDHALVIFQGVAEAANYKSAKVNSLTRHYA